MNFIDKEYDVFRMFNDQWALATAGTIDNFNTMTIAWGSMGTIWGPPHTMFIGEIVDVIERSN